MFTTSVANIGPHEEIVVAIEYQETLRYDEGSFRLRFPLAITPRYIAGRARSSRASMTATPIASPRERRLRHAGAHRDRPRRGLRALRAVEHLPPDEASRSSRGHRFRSRWQDGPVPAARDFELAWTPDVGAAPAPRSSPKPRAARPMRC